MGLGVARSMRIAKDIASGLSYLHSKRPQRLVHRDLKPSNVLIETLSKIAKISDFGLGKALYTMQRGQGSQPSLSAMEAPSQQSELEHEPAHGSIGQGLSRASGSLTAATASAGRQ